MNDFLKFSELTETHKNLNLTLDLSNLAYDEVLDFYSNDTYDGDLLNLYLNVFRVNFTESKNIFKDYAVGENSNLEALRYFVHFMSTIVTGIEDPYKDHPESLSDLAFHSHRDIESK